jgi:hypothetical protein
MVSRIGASTQVALAKVFVVFSSKPRINTGQYHNQAVIAVFKILTNTTFFNDPSFPPCTESLTA